MVPSTHQKHKQVDERAAFEQYSKKTQLSTQYGYLEQLYRDPQRSSTSTLFTHLDQTHSPTIATTENQNTPQTHLSLRRGSGRHSLSQAELPHPVRPAHCNSPSGCSPAPHLLRMNAIRCRCRRRRQGRRRQVRRTLCGSLLVLHAPGRSGSPRRRRHPPTPSWPLLPMRICQRRQYLRGRRWPRTLRGEHVGRLDEGIGRGRRGRGRRAR